MDAQIFRHTLAQFATGITVVISRLDESTLHGMTVNSFTSVSLTPPLILFCADNQSETLRAVQYAHRFTVSFLAAHQRSLSEQFALLGPQNELMAKTPLSEGIDGIPYLRESLAFLDCKVESIVPAGDHHIILGHVDNLGILAPGDPLLYYASHYYRG